VKIRLGDVGVIGEHVFEATSSLEQLGIAFEVRNNPGPADLEYTSTDSITIELKAAGAIPPPDNPIGQADAGVSISFKKADAVLFQASNCLISSIGNLQSVGDEILSRYKRGTWAAQQVVITELVAAKAATILISNGQNARIDFAVNAQAAVDKSTLLNTEAKIGVARASGIGTRIVAAAGLTPLFKANGIKKRTFRDPRFQTKNIDEAQFIELDYKDVI
jgi:hypothetical protein